MSLPAVKKNGMVIDSAMSCISGGSESGTFLTHPTSSESGMAAASASDIPRILGALAASESLLPPQSGQTLSLRKRSTLFMPCSSLTFARAFSTVRTALK